MKRWLACLAFTVVSGMLSATPTISSLATPHPRLPSAVTIAGTNFGAGTVAYGPVGTPVEIHGANFGSSGTVTFAGSGGGTVTAWVTSWSSTTIAVAVPGGAGTGYVMVTVGAETSNGEPFLVTHPKGTYSASCPQCVNPPTGPAAPSGLIATAAPDGRSVALSWTDNATDETSYSVQRCTGASCIPTEIATGLAADSTTYDDTPVLTGTTYGYEVCAVNAVGWTCSSARYVSTAGNAPSAGQGTHYYISDHLGSATVIVNGMGGIEDESVYYPFGCERVITSATSGNRYKFTGKERDSETGLDYFGARYYGCAMGRLLTPDPFIPFNLKKEKFQAWISNPQHWNKYAYALNNPLLYVDPSGMTETIYYWLNSRVTDEQKKFFQEHKTEILNAIADKLKQAGIKDVVFKEGSDLSKSQVEAILKEQPKGVAFLNFANKSYGGLTPDSATLGNGQGIRAAVYIGNIQAGNPSANELVFRIGQVSDHELGHGMGFYSRGETMSFIMFWNKDLMNDGQPMPRSSSPRYFDMSIPQNRQAVEEINKLPEYKPPK